MQTSLSSFPFEEIQTRLKRASQLLTSVGYELLQMQEDYFANSISSSEDHYNKIEKVCLYLNKKFANAIHKDFSRDSINNIPDFKNANSDFQWYFEALDGQRNFTHKVPHFCTAAAICFRSEPVGSVVHIPSSHDTYHAISEDGAYKNQKRLQVSQIKKIEFALTASGLPYRQKRQTELTKILDNIAVFIASNTGLRRSGSAILDICWIAEGLFDAFWERSFKSHVLYPVYVILKEAGGKISNFNGKSDTLVQAVPLENDILASNGHLHKDLVELLKKVNNMEGMN